VDGGVYSPIGSPYLYPGQQLAVPPSATEDEYADYMIRYLLITLCSGMIDRVYWWRLAAHGFGLVDDADPDRWRPRPAFHALSHFLARLGDATFVRRPSAPEGVQLFEFKRADGEIVVLAYAHPEPRRFELPFAHDGAEDALGQSVSAPGSSVELTGRPVYFRGVAKM
jgi:hypothetical protein